MRTGTGIAVALVLIAGIASADPTSDEAEHKRADALFDEAQALVDAGKLEQGCAKFEESLSHDKNAIGTILNIAKCQARLGRIASAYATYADVRDRAKLQNQPEYGARAEENLAQLAPFVPHLAIALGERRPDGVEVLIDDKPIKIEAIADIPLDPGSHVVIVRAKRYRSHEERITIAKKERHVLTVAALELDQPAQAFPTGMVVTASGGGLVLVGVVMGLVARSHYNDAIANQCHGDRTMCVDGGDAANSARTLGTVGTVIGVTGLVAAGVGGYLWWSSRHGHDHEHERLGVAPVVGGDRVGVLAFGRF